MSHEPTQRNVLPTVPTGAIIALLALVKFALQFAVAGRYGIFRDELYYLACAQHLDWGYVDHPPLIAWVTWCAAHVFGTSLYGLRLLPAVAGALLVVLTAGIAQQLGGGRFARCLAAFAILPVPVYLMLHHWLTMNAFEPLIWMTIAWLTLRMLTRNSPRHWLAISAVIGLGLENKYSVLFLVASLLLALLLTPQRRILRSWWFPAGVALALLLFLPNLLWLAHHHFPFLEFERHSRMSSSRILRAPLAFLADQALMMNPLLAPLWCGGLAWLLFSARAKKYRFLGLTFLGVLLVLLLLQAKNYYVCPVYPFLFAAGAVAFEQWTSSRARWLRGTYVGLTLAAGIILAPFALPVLPVDQFLAYQRVFGGFTPVQLERELPIPCPQQFADEFGWEQMVQKTAAVFHSLPVAEQRHTAIFANDYGEAAAIDFFGPKYGLPKAIGNHETYWLWGRASTPATPSSSSAAMVQATANTSAPS